MRLDYDDGENELLVDEGRYISYKSCNKCSPLDYLSTVAHDNYF